MERMLGGVWRWPTADTGGAIGHSAIAGVTLQLPDVTGKYELPH
jgi:hypothetical protein